MRRWIVAVVIALGLGAAACGGSGGDGTASTEPVDVASLALSADAAAGLPTYQAKCQSCHARDLTGGAGPALGPGSEAAGKALEDLRGTIVAGGNGMPSWGGLLTDAEIDQVLAFVVAAQGR